MARFAIPGTAPLTRVVRGLWPDRNPLRRRTDRAAAAIVAALLALLAVGAPLAAVTAGRVAYHYGSGAQHAQQAARYQVPAVLLTSVPAVAYVGGIWVKARWTAPDGAPGTGEILAPGGGQAGNTVMIWVDHSGRLAGAPLTRSQVTGLAWLAAVLGLIAFGIVVLFAGAIARQVLDQRRLAAWEAEWRAAGPQWTSRH